MSVAASAFLSGLGSVELAQAHRMQFTEPFDQMLWNSIYQEIGAGFYKNRFYQLFSAELSAYDDLLKLWHFALPYGSTFKVIGRNAYGALLLLENVETKGTAAPVRLLNPIVPAYWGDDHCVLMNCIGHWLPQQKIPGFSDSVFYNAYYKVVQKYLDQDEILAIKIPLALGGNIQADNFQPENIFDYYRSAASIYEKIFTKSKK